MPSNRHPADALAELRARISALKAREAVLRRQIIAQYPDLDPEGETHVLDLKTMRRRVFCPDRLPDGLRNRPELYELREQVTLRVFPRRCPPETAPDDADDFNLIEPS